MKKGERRLNRFRINGPATTIYIRRFWDSDVECLIDTEDLDKVRRWTWTLAGPIGGNRYARSSERKTVMHRLVLGAPAVADGVTVVDHINGNSLDNRKANLRLTNQSVNNHNRVNAPPKNVHWHKQNKCWRVRFMIRRQFRDFGLFHSLAEATAVAGAVREKLRRGEPV